MKNHRLARCFSLFAGVLLLANVAAAQCDLYPIALSVQTLANVAPGTDITDILNGTQPGNFGWLTWTGSPSEPTLVTSLSGAGNSDNYINPTTGVNEPIVAGDWVQGKPGVSNSKAVRNALNALESEVINVPVWDISTGKGNNTLYHVVGFAQVQITGYQLPKANRISVLFLGFTSCGVVNPG